MSWSFWANREAPWNARGGRRATFDEAKQEVLLTNRMLSGLGV
jgi:hypothetical protein